MNDPKVFLFPVKTGDAISMFGCFKKLSEQDGVNPVVFCPSEYASVYDGISYVTAIPVEANWITGMEDFKKAATEKFGRFTNLRFWSDDYWPEETKDTNWIFLEMGGRQIRVDSDLDPDIGTAIARRIGFTREEWIAAPVVFDRRDPTREQQLLDRYVKPSTKPLLLYNFTAVSSPFGYEPEMVQALNKIKWKFNTVNIGRIHCARIYDLLALYDNACGLITCDTATAHLAVVSKVPTVWFTMDAWRGSVPRGNVHWSCSYSESITRIDDVIKTCEKWKDSWQTRAGL